MNKLFSITMAVLWLATANHCFVVDAFAKRAQPIHTCCPDSGTKQTPSGPHQRDSDKACCQVFVKDTNGSRDLAAPASALTPILLPILSLVHDISLAPASGPRIVPSALGPPGELKDFLISLTLAPNAPPQAL